ncbi:m12.5 protein [Murid betaherpesvirus 1]|nr:m12.5 protein [Murid betaherpesvirus 1]
MFRRYPTGILTTVVLPLAIISPTFFVSQILRVSAEEKCNEVLIGSSRPCTSLPPGTRETTPDIIKTLRTKKENQHKTFLLQYSCLYKGFNCYLNATWTGEWFTINTESDKKRTGEEETTIAYVLFTSTSSSPPTFTRLTIVEPRVFPQLWFNSTTGEIYFFSNISMSPLKCRITLCFGASTPPPPKRRIIAPTPFRSTNDHNKNLETTASRRTIDNGTIAAIVIVIAICVGLVVLAVLYYRGYIGHSRRLNPPLHISTSAA